MFTKCQKSLNYYVSDDRIEYFFILNSIFKLGTINKMFINCFKCVRLPMREKFMRYVEINSVVCDKQQIESLHHSSTMI